MAVDDFGEPGFDRMRFGGDRHGGGSVLSDALSLLIRIPDKTRLDVRSLDLDQVGELVRICAGGEVSCRRIASSPDAVAVTLGARTLTLADDQPCGLRDLILAAVLFRSYREAGSPQGYDLDRLIDAAQLALLEELPQALGYSTAAAMAGAGDGVHPTLEIEQVAAGSGEPEIHFQVA